MTPLQELQVLQQDVRTISEQQRVLGGIIDTVIEDNDYQRQQIRRLESEKAALLAANEELQQALRRIVQECAR